MAKITGLGQRLLRNGRDLSADISSVGTIATELSPIEVGAINDHFSQRIGGITNASMDLSLYYNPVGASLYARRLTDPRIKDEKSARALYLLQNELGGVAFALDSVPTSFNISRAEDGSVTGSTAFAGNGQADWGELVTDGLWTYTHATTIGNAPRNMTGGATGYWNRGSVNPSPVYQRFWVAWELEGAGDADIVVQESSANTFASPREIITLGVGSGSGRTLSGQRLLRSSQTTSQRYMRARITGAAANTITSAKIAIMAA